MANEAGQIRDEELDAQRDAVRRTALAQIRQYGDAALRLEARPVEDFDDDLRRLVARMTRLMVDANGVGLAATQVGVLRRVVVFQEDSDDEPIALVNPVIVERGGELSTDDEGCLSLQGVLVPVERLHGHRRGQGRDGRGRTPRARGARRPRRAARARPPGRRTDHRPDDARGAARGARRVAAAGRAGWTRLGRIGVAATAPFGADVLERLAGEHELAFLLTRPDRPRGRGRRPGPPPAKVTAGRLGIPVLQPERLTPDVELDADTIVVAAYGVLIPSVQLERALWLNVHPSLLPRWRGAAPVERAIMAGDRNTGVTIHRTTPELDAGPIAAQRAFPIEPDDDAGAVYAKAAPLAAELLGEVLPEPIFRPQRDEGATYAEKITAADRELDWSPPPRRSSTAFELCRRTSARAQS